MLRPFNERHRN